MAIKVATVAEVRAIEAAADRDGISYAQMMRRAGRAASSCLQSRLEINAATSLLVLVGKGNNGGDGLVMALDLAKTTSALVRLYLLEARDDQHFHAALDAGLVSALAADDSDGAILASWVKEATVIVDALFGIGARLPLCGPTARLLGIVENTLNTSDQLARTSDFTVVGDAPRRGRKSTFVLALDCPSGVDCDDGRADLNTITADATISFITAKPGLLSFPAAAKVGDLAVAALGIPPDLPALESLADCLMDGELAAALLPPRPVDGHKGTFGKVMLVAGSPNYIGAVALAGEGAARSGVGLVTVATSSARIDSVSGNLREPTWLPLETANGAISERASETVIQAAQDYNALLVGCGLGLHERTLEFLRGLLAAKSLPPLILDADALNALSQQTEWWRSLPADSIITPHSGEMSRLTGLATARINASRWQVARDFAAKWQAVVLLKGAHSIIAAPSGETSVIPFKTDALGTAGTGDVLAGLIAGLRAQGSSAYDSARLGAYLHASAGMIAAQAIGSSRSVIAGDVLAALGKAFKRIEGA